MSKHDDTLYDRQFSEHDRIEKDGYYNNGPCEQGSLPGVDHIMRICKDDDSLYLLAGSITGTRQGGMPA